MEGKFRLATTAAMAAALVACGGTVALAQQDEGSCTLSERTCAMEGFVIVSLHADRLINWRNEETFYPLRPAYARSFLERAGPWQAFTLVIGRRDLTSGTLDMLIEEIIDRGGSVIVTKPTLQDADRLDQLTGLGSAAWDGQEAALLYGVRAAIDDGRTHEMGFVLLSDAEAVGKSCRYCLNDDETAWLLERIGRSPAVLTRDDEFSLSTRASLPTTHPVVMLDFLWDGLHALLTPPAAAQSSTQCDSDPEGCLTKLAQATHTSVKKSSHGGSFEVDNFVYSARSFPNQQDYYFVDQQFQVTSCPDSGEPQVILIAEVSNTPSLEGSGVQVASTLQPSPGSTQKATTVTNSVDFGIGGEAGYEQGLGGVADVAPSLAISHSKTTTVPPVQIENKTDTRTGVTEWAFITKVDPSSDTVFNTSWIWAIDLSRYQGSSEEFVIYTDPEVATIPGCNFSGYLTKLASSIDQPFPTQTIEPPLVSSVLGTPVSPGGNFEINGTGFYPSLVEDVLLGGNALAGADFSVASDAKITVTAPDDPSVFPFDQPLAVEVKTSKGTSNTNVVVTIVD